jgi:hypothetical protein
MDAVFHVITVAALAFFAYWLRLVKTGTEAAVKTTAEEAAKAAIRQLQWPAEKESTRSLQSGTRLMGNSVSLRFSKLGAFSGRVSSMTWIAVSVDPTNRKKGRPHVRSAFACGADFDVSSRARSVR